MSDKLIFLFRFLIAIGFIILSIVIYFYRDVTGLSPTQTYIFSALLAVYGLFRVYRAYKAAENFYSN